MIMLKPGLERLEIDLNICAQHLKETGNTETHLEKLIVGLALGLIYREYERCIRDSIVQRAKITGDDHLAQYVKLSVRRLGMASNKLQRDIYKTFSGDPKKTPSKVVKNAWKKYDKLRELRNTAMHHEDVSKGLDDVLEMHHRARVAVYDIRDTVLGDTKQHPMSYDDYSNSL